MEIFWEALEDYSLGKAIEEGLSTKSVSKEEILKILESQKVQIEFKESFLKDLKKLKDKELKDRVKKVI